MERIVIGEKVSCDYRKTVYGIVERGGKLLLVYSEKDNDYSLIGGGIEPGESLEQALQREFLEESGFYIKRVKDFANIDCYWTKKDGRIIETDANFFIVDIDERSIQNPTEAFHKPIWVERENVIHLINFPYQKKALELYFKK